MRCGGPNSGHTVTVNDRDVVLRQVPCSTAPKRGIYCLAAGCVVDEPLLIRELDLLGIEKDRVVVDPRAVVLIEHDRQEERASLNAIGSTCSGNGSALVRRMLRRPTTLLARQSNALMQRCRVESVAPLLHQALERGEHVIVEGTQGFLLSLLHGPDYPWVTSRDTSAAAFAMEVGLSPRSIDHIVMVIRTFPIPVGDQVVP